jgi:hypothetical protein
MRQPRQRARHREVAEPGKTAPNPKGAPEPGSTSSNRLTGLSPECLEMFGKLGVALVEAAAKLIDAISRLH